MCQHIVAYARNYISVNYCVAASANTGDVGSSYNAVSSIVRESTSEELSVSAFVTSFHVVDLASFHHHVGRTGSASAFDASRLVADGHAPAVLGTFCCARGAYGSSGRGLLGSSEASREYWTGVSSTTTVQGDDSLVGFTYLCTSSVTGYKISSNSNYANSGLRARQAGTGRCSSSTHGHASNLHTGATHSYSGYASGRAYTHRIADRGHLAASHNSRVYGWRSAIETHYRMPGASE